MTPTGIDTPKDTPSKRWLLRDIGGCQLISRMSRGLLVDTQASAGQAWLQATEPQAVGGQCRLCDIEFALDLDVKRFQTAQRKIGPPVGRLVHEAQVWKSPRHRCDR